MKETPFLHILIIITFIANTIGLNPLVQAQEFYLPTPGVRVGLSPDFNPPILKGIKVNPNNPFQFDFILNQGDEYYRHPERSEGSQQEQLKIESTKLIKYFLASLTIPENDLWVNLSPYEKNRIIPQSFGQTEMGRDLLAEDYMLKQITASLIYPEGETGKKFWKKVYEEAQKKYGTTNVPINTFNKVWIIPDKAVVYENVKSLTAYVVESKLKVMLEEDYLSLEKHKNNNSLPLVATVRSTRYESGRVREGGQDVNALGSQIVREIVIPELTKEVNEDKNFAQLRQVYNSLILATWYKNKIKSSILAQVYEDKKKVAGVEALVSLRGAKGDAAISKGINSETDVDFIYQRYLQAFKKGVFNFIKEEPIFPPTGGEGQVGGTIPRKYFSGGELLVDVSRAMVYLHNKPQLQNSSKNFDVNVNFAMSTENQPEAGAAQAVVNSPDHFLNQLSADQLSTTLREGFRTKKFSFVSRYLEWKGLSTEKPKALIVGVYVLKKINGEWCLLLGQRRPKRAADKEGFYTEPAGKVDHDIDPQYESPDEVAILKGSNLLRDEEVFPKIENPLAAGVRELYEEAGIRTRMERTVARLDTFKGNHEGQLINPMIVIDADTSAHVPDTEELINFRMVPLRLILNSPDDVAATNVEGFLNAPLLDGIRNSGLKLLRKLLLEVATRVQLARAIGGLYVKDPEYVVAGVSAQQVADELKMDRNEVRQQLLKLVPGDLVSFPISGNGPLEGERFIIQSQDFLDQISEHGQDLLSDSQEMDLWANALINFFAIPVNSTLTPALNHFESILYVYLNSDAPNSVKQTLLRIKRMMGQYMILMKTAKTASLNLEARAHRHLLIEILMRQIRRMIIDLNWLESQDYMFLSNYTEADENKPIVRQELETFKNELRLAVAHMESVNMVYSKVFGLPDNQVLGSESKAMITTAEVEGWAEEIEQKGLSKRIKLEWLDEFARERQGDTLHMNKNVGIKLRMTMVDRLFSVLRERLGVQGDHWTLPQRVTFWRVFYKTMDLLKMTESKAARSQAMKAQVQKEPYFNILKRKNPSSKFTDTPSQNMTAPLKSLRMYKAVMDFVNTHHEYQPHAPLRVMVLGPGSEEELSSSPQAVELEAVLSASTDNRIEIVYVDKNKKVAESVLNSKKYRLFYKNNILEGIFKKGQRNPDFEPVAQVLVPNLTETETGNQVDWVDLLHSDGVDHRDFNVDIKKLRRQKIKVNVFPGEFQDIDYGAYPKVQLDLVVESSAFSYALRTLPTFENRLDLLHKIMNTIKHKGQGMAFFSSNILDVIFEKYIHKGPEPSQGEQRRILKDQLAVRGLQVEINQIDDSFLSIRNDTDIAVRLSNQNPKLGEGVFTEQKVQQWAQKIGDVAIENEIKLNWLNNIYYIWSRGMTREVMANSNDLSHQQDLINALFKPLDRSIGPYKLKWTKRQRDTYWQVYYKTMQYMEQKEIAGEIYLKIKGSLITKKLDAFDSYINSYGTKNDSDLNIVTIQSFAEAVTENHKKSWGRGSNPQTTRDFRLKTFEMVRKMLVDDKAQTSSVPVENDNANRSLAMKANVDGEGRIVLHENGIVNIDFEDTMYLAAKTLDKIIIERLIRENKHAEAEKFENEFQTARKILKPKVDRGEAIEEDFRAYYAVFGNYLTDSDLIVQASGAVFNNNCLKALQLIKKRTGLKKLQLQIVGRGMTQQIESFLQVNKIRERLALLGYEITGFTANRMQMARGGATGKLEGPVVSDKNAHVPKGRLFIGDERDQVYGFNFFIDVNDPKLEENIIKVIAPASSPAMKAEIAVQFEQRYPLVRAELAAYRQVLIAFKQARNIRSRIPLLDRLRKASVSGMGDVLKKARDALILNFNTNYFNRNLQQQTAIIYALTQSFGDPVQEGEILDHFQTVNAIEVESSVAREARVINAPGSKAMTNGGIDLTPAKMNVQIKAGSAIETAFKFHLDPAMLAKLRNAQGLMPVIVSVKPLKSIQGFLSGIVNQN